MLVNGDGKQFSSQNTEASVDRNTGIRARHQPQPTEWSLRSHRKNLENTIGWYNYRTLQLNNGSTYVAPHNFAVYTVDDRMMHTELTRLNQFNVSRRWS